MMMPSAMFTAGVCFPDSCSQENITQVFQGIAYALNISTPIATYCFPEHEPWDAKNIIAV